MATVVGLRELVKTLKQAGDDLADLKDANAATATLIANAAAATAPRRTGKLAGTGRGNRAAGKAVIQFGRATVPYANVIHWGWLRRHIKPHPFASDAAQRTESQWVPIYFEAVQRIVDKVHGA